MQSELRFCCQYPYNGILTRYCILVLSIYHLSKLIHIILISNENRLSYSFYTSSYYYYFFSNKIGSTALKKKHLTLYLFLCRTCLQK